MTSLSFTKVKSGIGMMVTVFSVALIAFLLIKGSLNAKKDTRITRSGMYTFSIVATVIAAFFIMYFVMIMSVASR